MERERGDIKFSKRGDALIGQEMFHLLDLSKNLELEGKHVYHLELGDPKNYRGYKNYPPGRVINKTIMSLLNYDVSYASSSGLLPLRQKLALYFSEKFAKEIKTENIVISTANLLIYQILDIICESNDIVALFTPTFPSYIASCKYINATIHKVPLLIDDCFELTKNCIDKAFSVRPKVVFVNSGNNPTGAVYDEEVLKYLLEQAIKHDCWVVSDETYGMLCYNKEYFSMINLDYEKLVIISSFSKVFNIPGYRIGYAIADHRVTYKISLSSSTLYSCLPVFTQEGIIEGIFIIDKFAADQKKYYKKLSSECMKILNKSDYLSCIAPASAFYLFIDIRKLEMNDKLFSSRLLEDYRTVVTPGTSFGYEGFIRASICGNIDDVKNGLRQIVLFAKLLGSKI
jgi:aspartate/methionine/tyrosine aminotransferase